MEVNYVVLTSIIGLLAGAIGSLIAPWVKWGIEKRKLRYQNRQQVIIELKTFIAKDDFNRKEFINLPSYLLVRDKFSEETIKELEKPSNHITVVSGRPVINFEKRRVLNDIVKIEKDWKII